MTEIFLDVRTYTIAIIGQYFQSNLMSKYYLSKFSTKYNLTEYMIMSNDVSTMEMPKVVKLDTTNRLVYVALEINKNKYWNRTVYSPGDLPPKDNSNVAIVAYSWNHGVRLWVTVLGDKNFSDSFVSMQNYGGYLYVVLNSFSMKYSSNSSTTDINYYKLRTENGYLSFNQTFGSPQDDKALDLKVTYAGVYILGTINNPFQPHRSNNMQWQTMNSQTNIAIILIDFTDKILDIEGYDLTSAGIINPLPSKFFVKRVSGSTAQNFIFISHRTNNLIDKGGGIFITKITSNTLIFRKTSCSASNCQYCNPKDTFKCIQCQSGYFLYQYQCYSQCPIFTYSTVDLGLNPIYNCQPCHYSCLTCTGSSQFQCTSCCQNGFCGATLDRVPTLGQCKCPSGTTEANGLCGYQCSLNFQGRRKDQCYTQCPDNSYPYVAYDQAVAQEVSQFDVNSPPQCESYQNQLVFKKTGKGLAVSGPSNLQQMPKEFTVSFWLFLPSPTPLNTKTTFINAFNRIKIYALSSSLQVYYNFITGTASFVQPTYNSANQVLALDSWNYVVVSQREIQIANALYYEMQMAIAQSNTGTVLNTGYSNSIPVINYGLFANIIYLGADSDITPGSFNGYLKEVKLFSVYHGFPQMMVDQPKLYRLYSYDDDTLIAYWKLSESYDSTNIQYTIKDYSFNQESITYSIYANPDYPSFIVDSSNKLSLCAISDVKTCLSLDYTETPPIQTSVFRLMTSPTFVLKDFSLVKQTNDQIWFLPNNTKCNQQNQIIATLNYSTVSGNFQIPNFAQSPLNLADGTHYQVCYNIQSLNIQFNLMQLYIAARPKVVDPQSGSIYNRTGNIIQWMTGGGDQAYGDVIRFMKDCNIAKINQTEMIRSNTPDYSPITIFGGFNLTGNFYFCWYPVFVQDFMQQPYFEFIHNLRYLIQSEPSLDSFSVTTAIMNQDMIMFNLIGEFNDGDKFAMAWSGVNYSDCNPQNILGQQYVYNHSYWPGVWMGYNTGVHGVTTYQYYMDELQACWLPSSDQAPLVFIRVKKENMNPYLLRLFQYDNPVNQLFPELLSFNPQYGSATLVDTDTMINFNFKPMTVYPAKNGATQGKIAIYRGAIMADGTVVKMDTYTFWQNTQLDESHLPDPFQQGDLICSQTGQCNIVLSSQTNKLKGGEIYYLSFYTYSFANIVAGTKYFLFGSKPIPATQPGYDHLFFCRSFNIFSSDKLINGDKIVVYGTDLLTKTIFSKYVGGAIQSDIFYTKTISVKMKVYNTDSTFCVAKDPVGTVAIQDVTNTQFTISNVILRDCNQGKLFANIEVIRGIPDQYGQFSYLRTEKMYNVELGSIGCHSSCKSCNGTTSSNCQICSSSTDFIYMGTCYKTCPSQAAYFISTSVTFQSLVNTQYQCVSACPLQYYPNPITGECLKCNALCQTCNSNNLASCQSCNPVKYLYSGMCLTDCPQPHHQNNFTDYVCHNKSSSTYLKVKIQSLGFKQAIPKDKLTYLVADIDNTGGGTITSIEWTQLDTGIDSSVASIFTQDDNGMHNYKNQIVKLNSNAFQKIQEGQAIQALCRVNNSIGETSYDIYEFYLNDSPYTGNITLTFVGLLSTANGTTIDSIMKVNLTGWYDTPDDKKQELKLSVHMIVSKTFGTETKYTQYTLTQQAQANDIYLRIPIVPSQKGLLNFYLCVKAFDKHQASSTLCTGVNNMVNNDLYIKDINSIIGFIKSLNFSGNITNVLLTSHILMNGILPPLRSNTQSHICTLDVHCSYNGVCDFSTGVAKCICVQGYQGSYCQFQDYGLQALKDIAVTMINEVETYIEGLTEIDAFAIEVIGNVVRGLCNVPDIIDDYSLLKLINLMEKVSSASIYAHQGVDKNVTQVISEAYSGLIKKIYHSYKQRRSSADNSVAASGASILDYSSTFNIIQDSSVLLNNRLRSLSNIQENEYYSKQGLLLGGRKDNKQRVLISSQEQYMYRDWARRVDSSLTIFFNQVTRKLGPNWDTFISITDAFLFQARSMFAPYIPLQEYYMTANDAWWSFPSNLFSRQQGRASSQHEVKMKLVKYINNPFFYEQDIGAILEQNITQTEFLTQGMQVISIDLSGLNTFINAKEPFEPTSGFNIELLKCMIWDETQKSFVNDFSCGFSFQTQSPPSVQGDLTPTQISQCRCSHLTRFGVVYELTSPMQGVGSVPSIYSNFYAMKYWKNSFGIVVVLGGVIVFFLGHIVIHIIDQRMQHNLILQLREKVRKFEMMYGRSVRRLDGMFFIPERQQQNMAKKRKFKNKDRQEEEKGLLKKSNEDEENDNALMGQKDFKEYDEKRQDPKGKKKMLPKKKFAQDALENEPDEEASVEVAVKGKRPMFQKKKAKVQKGMISKQVDQDDLEDQNKKGYQNIANEELKEDDENPNIQQEQQEEVQGEREKLRLELLEKNQDDEKEEKFPEYLSQQQIEQLKNQRKVFERIRGAKDKDHLHHILIKIQAEEIQGMTKKEFKKTIMKEKRKFKGDQLGDLESKFENLQNQLNSTDEEIYIGLKQKFEEETKQRQENKFILRNMLIEGSYILSLIYVTSILCPRHVRWTLAFANICILWYITAVIFNNTQNPLQVPDFQTKASSQAIGQLWIGCLSPMGSMIVMYIVASFFKVSNTQILFCSTNKQLDIALYEVKKEMKLRFMMTYGIIVAAFGIIFWYVIKFTSDFGWKVSWIWFYCGIFAIFLQIFILDPLISLASYGIFKVNRRLGRFLMKCRSLKQTQCELLENPFDEDDDNEEDENGKPKRTRGKKKGLFAIFNRRKTRSISKGKKGLRGKKKTLVGESDKVEKLDEGDVQILDNNQ